MVIFILKNNLQNGNQLALIIEKINNLKCKKCKNSHKFYNAPNLKIQFKTIESTQITEFIKK